MVKVNLEHRSKLLSAAHEMISQQCDRIAISKYNVARNCRTASIRTVDGFLYQKSDISASTFLEILSLVGLQIVPKQSTLE